MNAIGHVNDHYTKYCGSPDYLEQRSNDIALIGFQESLSRDFEALKQMFGFSGHELPSDDKLAHRSSRKSDPLDERATRSLRKWYAKDIEIYEWSLANAERVNGIAMRTSD